MSQMKLARPLRVADAADIARDADVGGIGLDWTTPPAGLLGSGAAAWQHLAVTFADDPTRFREGDRQAVASYCQAVEMADAAAAALREHGVLVAGRSSAELGRPVRSPAWAMWRDAQTAVRQWSTVLGLTPGARATLRLPDAPRDDDNPFTT